MLFKNDINEKDLIIKICQLDSFKKSKDGLTHS